MKIIGITGTTGAGKSVVCEEFRLRGAEIIDADKISREVSKRNGAAFDEIVGEFGKEILMENGEINRKILGGIVFNDEKSLKKLNAITHKHIFNEMEKRISKSKAQIVVLDVPLLFQSDFPFKCDFTVAVIAPPEVRIKRIMERDKITRDAALLRMKNQQSDEEYAELADICFENNGDLKKVTEFVDCLVK